MGFKTKYAIGAIVFACLTSGAAFAQNWRDFETVGNWTIKQYPDSEISDGGPSCSAITFVDHINALRIERVSKGYAVGFNGWNREYDGNEKEVEFWFDDETSTTWENTAFFVKDAAYDLDDWLSIPHALDAQPSLQQAFSGRQEITIVTKISPENINTTVWSLVGVSEALAGLERCYADAIGGASNAQPAGGHSADCPDDGPRLPGSGLCKGRAVNYLDYTHTSSLGPDGCDWVVNETALPDGDFLLYQALQCGSQVATLEFHAGPHAADLMMTTSAMSGSQLNPPSPVARVFATHGGSAQDVIMMQAQSAMSQPDQAKRCEVRMSTAEENLEENVYVVDLKPEFKFGAATPQVSPCGDFGLRQDSLAFWRVIGDWVWFIDMGLGFWEINPQSMVVLTAEDLRNH